MLKQLVQKVSQFFTPAPVLPLAQGVARRQRLKSQVITNDYSGLKWHIAAPKTTSPQDTNYY